MLRVTLNCKALKVVCTTAVLVLAGSVFAQERGATPSAKPTEHVLGTITAVDATAHTIKVKDDKSGAESTIALANTKTLLKVEPGAKDLKNATRITADDLAVNDRVDVRGFKAEGDPNAIAARSVVLMSARDLAKARQAQTAEWQHSTAGVVTATDPASGKITITSRGAEGPKTLVVDTSSSTQFTRYAPDNPSAPAPSQLTQIQTGDQVRVLGEASADGSYITAQKIYSGAFRTLNGTVASIAPDGKEVTIKNLATKKPVEITLTDNSAVRKLPPMMAMALARRFNPSYNPTGDAGRGAPPNSGSNPSGSPAYGAKSGEADASNRPPTGGGAPAENGTAGGGAWQRPGGGAGGPGAGMRPGRGDISQMIERLPKISISDLKPGDAVVVSGIATDSENTRLIATNVIAGVEPILQSAPNRQNGQAMGGDWGLGEMAIPQ